jgi:hypothetical protein
MLITRILVHEAALQGTAALTPIIQVARDPNVTSIRDDGFGGYWIGYRDKEPYRRIPLTNLREVMAVDASEHLGGIIEALAREVEGLPEEDRLDPKEQTWQAVTLANRDLQEKYIRLQKMAQLDTRAAKELTARYSAAVEGVESWLGWAKDKLEAAEK